ncbi:MAG: PilZ domain-containing protein [Planctomycetes bacterium]|nr:PilZ domain-containing protein [Planctomycetota bacterium]
MDIFGDADDAGRLLDTDLAFDMLQELEQNTPDEIRRQRAHFRLAVKAFVTLQPGNASDALKFKMQGTTGDLSEGGCRILFPLPVRVGDVYRLEFDKAQLELPLTLARCVRCLLLREDAYKAGFAFFSPIALPRNAQATSQQTLS